MGHIYFRLIDFSLFIRYGYFLFYNKFIYVGYQ